MKLTIERGALLKSLGHVQNVVERRNTIPILSNVLLEAGSNALGLTATDMDLPILIDRSKFAISTEETRYYLNGIYLHVADSQGGKAPAKGGTHLRAVATDGHRLARVEMAAPSGASGMPGVIVPRKTVGELRKLIDETEETIDIALSDTRIRFAFDAVTLSSKLIDGNFPDYQRVIPTGNDKTMTVDRRMFAEAVDRVSTIASEKSRAIKISLKKGSMILSASSPEYGSAHEELEIAYDGTPIEIGFNARYLLDITAQLQGSEAEFKLADAAS